VAFLEILQNGWVGLGIVGPGVIEILNIFQASCLAMERAIRNLSVTPDFLLVDGHLPLRVPQERLEITDGDQKSLSIACASIVAKVLRDRMMAYYDRLYPQYGFIRHKGYGTPEHLNALETHGPSPIHRQLFHPVCEMTPHADHP